MQQADAPGVPNPLIHLVDDDREVRSSLSWLLNAAGFETAAHASAVEFLNGYADDHRPGCLLLDLRMPEMDGFELQALLKRRHCPLPVIFITGHGDVPLAVRAMRGGAFDFMVKPFHDGAVLIDRVQLAVELCQDEIRRRAEHNLMMCKVQRLSDGERQVWALMVAGKQNKVIADILSINIKTVEARRKSVLHKLETRSPSELNRMAALAAVAPDAAPCRSWT